MDRGPDQAAVYVAAWLSRVLAISRPTRHVDISPSPVFAAIASAFVPVDYYGPAPRPLRLADLRINVIDFGQLPFVDASVASLSCTGIIERLGFGRDGDPIDRDAGTNAIGALSRALAPDGSLLLSVPIGKPRVADGVRVFAFGEVLDAAEGLELEEFSIVPGQGEAGLLVNPNERFTKQESHGYGCFWLRKPARRG